MANMESQFHICDNHPIILNMEDMMKTLLNALLPVVTPMAVTPFGDTMRRRSRTHIWRDHKQHAS